MQLFTRITRLTLFVIHHLPPITNSITHTTIITSSITYNFLFYIILFIIFYNRESHCKILYSILLYQYYNIVNTCNHIVTIIIDMRYNYLIKYNYTDYNGNEQEILADDLLAIILQHEIDHLDGILYIDRLSRLKRTRLLNKLSKYREEESHNKKE